MRCLLDCRVELINLTDFEEFEGLGKSYLATPLVMSVTSKQIPVSITIKLISYAFEHKVTIRGSPNCEAGGWPLRLAPVDRTACTHCLLQEGMNLVDAPAPDRKHQLHGRHSRSLDAPSGFGWLYCLETPSTHRGNHLINTGYLVGNVIVVIYSSIDS